MQLLQSRRHFLAGASVAAAASVLGPCASLADEPPPETTRIRLKRTTSICFAPLHAVDAFLRAEGFTQIEYVTAGLGLPTVEMVERGELDFDSMFAGTLVYQLDAGLKITAVGGAHVGCFELFAREPIRTLSDLKGRRLGVRARHSSAHIYLSILAAYVGLDPREDIEWVVPPDGNAMELFAQGQTEAFLGFPPEPQELRSRGVSRVILNTTTDPPWSQYFCCMLYSNREFVQDHPVAMKRALRAMLKAADMCAADPAWAARRLVDGGFTERYDDALQTLTEIPYERWRELDPEDSMRFYALRLHEAGMIKSTPNALLAEGTDWRFLNELKRELKA
jgi:NitT/TauT family transport system substrate-binding protein